MATIARTPTTILIIGAWLAVAVALWPSTLETEAAWRLKADYGHGYLVIAILAWWLYSERRSLNQLPVKTDKRALFPLLVLLVLWLAAWRSCNAMITQLLWPPVIVNFIWGALGWSVARHMILPAGLVLISMPLWDYAVPFLQWLTVSATQALLPLLGVPAKFDGALVTIPAGVFEITGDCSGKKYLTTALMLGVAMLLVVPMTWARRALFFTVALVLALVFNWLRVLIIIYAGHATGMRHYFVAVEHLSLGWVIYGVLVLMLVWLARRWELVPDDQASVGNHGGSARNQDVTGLAAPVILLAAASLLALAETPAGKIIAKLGTQAADIPGWQGPLPADRDWRARFAGIDDEARSAYVAASGERIEVYLGVYGVQRASAEMINENNQLFGGSDWSAATMLGSREVDGYAVATRDSQRWVAGRVFRVAGLRMESEIGAQLWYGLNSLLTPQPFGVVVFAMPCANDCAREHLVLDAFKSSAVPQLSLAIPARRMQ